MIDKDIIGDNCVKLKEALDITKECIERFRRAKKVGDLNVIKDRLEVAADNLYTVMGQIEDIDLGYDPYAK